MQQNIGNTSLQNAQGIVGNVSGNVYICKGPEEASERKSCTSSEETIKGLTRRFHHPGAALKACREALFVTDPEIDRNDIIRAKGSRTQGTCEWIKSHPRFQSWMRGDARLLWIRGGPGKGKTMMSVYLTEEIATEQPQNFAYFFCISQDMQRNNACAVLRGLLWQITNCRPNLMQYLVPYFDPPERGRATRSSEETLWNLLKDMCRNPEAPRLYCLVDGVDECDEDSMYWLVDKFTSIEHDEDYRKLSLLALSRPIVGLDESTCITLDPDHHGQVSADVAIFVKSKVRELSQKLRVDTTFENHATKLLLEKSEGTFLWVGFVMAELLKKRTRSQVEKAMDNLPKGLPAVYARMLQNIEPDDRENSKKLLICASLAFRKLSLKALADILSCQSSATISEERATLDEIEICAPMLHFREQAVEFVHQSAKDYLLRDQMDHDPVLEGFRIRPEEAHLYLARRCLRSLEGNTYLQYYSLLNWPKHAKRLNDLATDFLGQERSFLEKSSLQCDTWWQKYSVNFPQLPEVVPPRLHSACFIGLKTWAQEILLEGSSFSLNSEDMISEECPGGWSAIDYAAEGAAGDLVKLLLDNTLSSRRASEQLQRSLCNAVLTRREGAARVLLKYGAEASAGDACGKPLLLHATTLQNRAIMQLLLEHGADPMVSDEGGVRPLEVACQVSQGQALVKLLLDSGADPDARNRDGHTPLNIATFFGNLRSVEVLLKHGAIPNLPSGYSYSEQGMEHAVIHTAVARERLDIIQLLVEHGANVYKHNGAGQTVLHAAVAKGRLDMIQLLTQHGADINMRDAMGQTVIHTATAGWSYVNSVKSQVYQFLTEAGVDVDASRHDGKTPLQVAKEQKCREAIKALRKDGAVWLRDVDGYDSFDRLRSMDRNPSWLGISDAAVKRITEYAFVPATVDQKFGPWQDD